MERRRFLKILGLGTGAAITGVGTFVSLAEAKEQEDYKSLIEKYIFEAQANVEKELYALYGESTADMQDKFFKMEGSFPFYRKGQELAIEYDNGTQRMAKYLKSEPTKDGYTNEKGQFIRTNPNRIYYFELI